MLLESRNQSRGFAARVQINLDYILEARRVSDADVHIVTQLTTSLLGLLVFPYEELRVPKPNPFESYSLGDLAESGWPAWKFIMGEAEAPNLDELLWHLRNAISHRRIQFLSESRALHEVEIEFRDRPPRSSADNWGASIFADQLLEFVRRLSDLLRTLETNKSQ